MAIISSRLQGTNRNVQSYDSAGGGADFTALATWEATIDIDTTASGTATTEVLQVRTGLHSDSVLIAGGTYDATFPLILEAESGSENNGTETGGARFTAPSAVNIFRSFSGHVYFHDLGITGTINSPVSFYAIRVDAGTGSRAVGIHVYDTVNSGTGSFSGTAFSSAGVTDWSIINCVANNVGGWGFISINGATGDMLNCTAKWITGTGGARRAFANIQNYRVINCISEHISGTSDFNGTASNTYRNNISSDATAPGINSLQNTTISYVSADFLKPLDSTQAAVGAGGVLAGDATNPFNDDIEGNERLGLWTIGAFQVAKSVGAPATNLKNNRNLITVLR